MAVKFKTERNIPLPKRKERNHYTEKAKRLKFGDSVFFDKKWHAQSLQRAAAAIGTKTTVHSVKNGFRLWVIK